MTIFIRLLTSQRKDVHLSESSSAFRSEGAARNVFEVDPNTFASVPGAPFSYWVSENIQRFFERIPSVEARSISIKQGLATADDFRFVRVWWESFSRGWKNFAKGGAYSPFYADVYLKVNWAREGAEIKSNLNDSGKVRSNVWMLGETSKEYFGRPGLTWPLRTQKFGVRIMPGDCVFGHKGPAAFLRDGSSTNATLALLALKRSRAFEVLVEINLNAGDKTARSYEVGIIRKIPLPKLDHRTSTTLSVLARQAWSKSRDLDTIEETSHAFLLPAAIRDRAGAYDLPTFNTELATIQAEIDEVAFDLYGFSDEDRRSAVEEDGEPSKPLETTQFDPNTTEARPELLSWAVGVAFGRFDWRLATGEREPPPEPEPFDPLPSKSPGMLPDGDEPFHAHDGILVDDRGHLHDLPRLIDDVLTRVDVDVPMKLRGWLRKDFFPHHLKQYSKSRRKAPIYWPLSTASGEYTLWIYYPTLTSQTLYTAVNDFVDPKLKDVAAELTRLRQKGADRSSADEARFAELGDFETELQDLRTTLLETAERYRPNQDDGVQITAAPLCPLFRHKPWQKLLKETWEELEAGKYDWAHLAMAYWPHRVVRSAHTDRSIAIAHDLEGELWHEVDVQDKRGKTKTEWQPRDLTDNELDLIVMGIQARRAS